MWYNILMNKVEIKKKLTAEQRALVDKAVKKTVKQYRSTLIRLAAT